ncbi:MAG: hypothetical protein WCL07_02815 [bacterium]
MQLIIDGGNEQTQETAIHLQFPQGDYIYTTILPEKNTIAVATIRALISSLATSTSKSRLIWIQNADCLTIASQNTLLKILEEPPESTSFVLTLLNKRALLPTILSRCTQLHLDSILATVDTEILQTIKLLMSQGYASRLIASTKLGKDREEVSAWFLSLLGSLHSTLQTTININGQKVLAIISNQASIAISQLSQNGNVTLVRDHFFLTLPKTK